MVLLIKTENNFKISFGFSAYDFGFLKRSFCRFFIGFHQSGDAQFCSAITDNPSLTTREVKGRNPVKILIDFNLKVPQNFNIYNNEAPTLVLNAVKDSEEKNVKFIKIERESFLENLINKLYENQIQSVIVEGGRFTLQQFIDSGIWDEAIIIKNEDLKLASGTKAPEFGRKNFETKLFRDNIIEFHKNL